jgi:hypothetical protein
METPPTSTRETFAGPGWAELNKELGVGSAHAVVASPPPMHE